MYSTHWLVLGMVPLYFCSMVSSQPMSSTSAVIPLCRDRYGYFEPEEFKELACSSCYVYLFGDLNIPLLPKALRNTSNGPLSTSACDSLTTDQCRRLEECCKAAEECCDRQQRFPDVGLPGYCPGTWDGYACWKETPPNKDVYTYCPQFIPHAIGAAAVVKTCTANGTWFRNRNSGLEWSNYTACFSVEDIRISTFVSMACNAASFAVLLPSIAIFTMYKSLRSQKRIQLHINLCCSLLLHNLLVILWDFFIMHDRITKTDASETAMHQNSAGCKLLCVLLRYSRSANYMCMFCEGCYLRQLLVNSFQPLHNLRGFYALGWGFPLIPTIIYSIIRIMYYNESCWIEQIGAWEWLFYTPNLLSLLANLCFLINILRVLFTQMKTFSNEPSTYRKVLRTIVILVPLFGLQLFLTIYRPPYQQTGAWEYQLASTVITSLQGFLVALMFCFFNAEVLFHLSRTFQRRPRMCMRRSRRFSASTQYSDYHSGRGWRFSSAHRVSTPLQHTSTRKTKLSSPS